MTTIEQRLARVYDELELPATDLVPAVMAELTARTPDTWRTRRDSRRALAAAAVIVFLAIAASVVVQPTREVLASWLGIGATSVERIDETGAGSPSSTVARTASSSSSVATAAGVDPIPALGVPDGVVDTPTARGRRYLWTAPDGFPKPVDGQAAVVLSVRLVDGPIDQKQLLADSDARHVPLDIGGQVRSAVWIGSDHRYVAAAEEPVWSEQVLIWVVGQIQYRLEADLPLEEMVTLAERVEGGTDLLQPG
ncbi:MAG: hypothetical protein AAGA65_07485 [Actinomycetota bacterium]